MRQRAKRNLKPRKPAKPTRRQKVQARRRRPDQAAGEFAKSCETFRRDLSGKIQAQAQAWARAVKAGRRPWEL